MKAYIQHNKVKEQLAEANAFIAKAIKLEKDEYYKDAADQYIKAAKIEDKVDKKNPETFKKIYELYIK
jgi:predicted NAD-dependent protein-ADP-ribosyltransferase YbiA (DUF1768 family)